MRFPKGTFQILVQAVLFATLATGIAMAQRGGGGHGGGGMGGGHVGGVSGGYHGGGVAVSGGYRGGAYGGVYHGGYYGGHYGYYGGHYGYYGGRYYGWPYYYGYWGGYWPYYGYGYSYGPGYSYYPYDYAYDYPYYPASYPTYSNSYPQAQPASNVTVVYPPQQPDRANPSMTEYDQYGQPVRRDAPAASSAPAGASTSGSPIYLIAFRDRTIRAVSAYWVNGNTLHYVTMEHQEQQAPLDSVDRSMSEQLNRERRVPFSLGR